MIKGIIFDFDGVILESAGIKTDAFRTLFEKRFPQYTERIVAYHLQNEGISRFKKFEYIFKNILNQPYDDRIKNDLGTEFAKIVMDKVLSCPFVEGSLEFLQENYRKYPLFVASGTPEEELRYIIRQRGIENYFKEAQGSPNTKSAIIKGILSRYSWDAQEVLFIGDAYSDLLAAQATGVVFIARNSCSTDKFESCCYVISDLHELKAVLNKLNGYK